MTQYNRSNQEALQAIREHHAILLEDMEVLTSKANIKDTSNKIEFYKKLLPLLNFVSFEVIPHALAEEKVIYSKAFLQPDLKELVAALTSEHQQIVKTTIKLPDVPSWQVESSLTDLYLTFSRHVQKENDSLLTRLAKDQVDLNELLIKMHSEIEQLTPNIELMNVKETQDSDIALASLITRASKLLYRSGSQLEALELICQTWKILQAKRPDLSHNVLELGIRLFEEEGS